jgi:ATP-dependent Lon protease
MAREQSLSLPVIPLPQGSVLLPGVVQRIVVSASRPDIAALLATVYTLAAAKGPNGRIDAVPIACVPLASPLLSRDGQLLIQDGEKPEESGRKPVDPENLTKEDLFGWGVVAKITGVEGRGTGEFTLLVEGVARIKIQDISTVRPYFEAKVTYFQDEGIFFSDFPYSQLKYNASLTTMIQC